MLSLLSGVLLFCVSALADPGTSAGTPAGANVWFEGEGGHHAVALVAHGLNLKPERMDWISGHLQASGVDVLRISLKGHESALDDARRLGAMKTVTDEQWLDEFRVAAREARKRADRLHVPLYFVGFSLGGLLGEVLLGESPADARFDRVVLLAPAIVPRFRVRLFVSLSRMFGARWIIPSANRPDYRANPGTSLAAYRAMDRLVRRFEESLGKGGARFNIPTLVFMDPDDEGLDFGALKDLIAASGWTAWQLDPVSTGGSRDVPVIHHLIIDARSVGPAQWSGMLEKLDRHFFLSGPRPQPGINSAVGGSGG